MRIITGLYKGRRFDIPRSFKARPTTDFAKENIFNVLAGHIDLEGKQALDLFSGTGSITLELLSRGCDRVVSVEIDRDHHAFIKQCLAKIGAVNCLPLRADALRFVKSCRQKFDFIFADPPYALGELAAIPGMVFASGILSEGGVFVLEHGAKNDFSSDAHFIERREYGSVNFSIFKGWRLPAFFCMRHTALGAPPCHGCGPGTAHCACPWGAARLTARARAA